MSKEQIEDQINEVFSEIDAENPGLVDSFDVQAMQAERQEYLAALSNKERCLYLLGNARGMLSVMPTFDISTAVPAFSILINSCVHISQVMIGLGEGYPPEARSRIAQGALTALGSIENIPRTAGARQRMGNMILHLFDADTALLHVLAVLRQDNQDEVSAVHARKAQAALDAVPSSFQTMTEMSVIIDRLWTCQLQLLDALQILVADQD